jgi:hypothetical protein
VCPNRFRLRVNDQPDIESAGTFNARQAAFAETTRNGVPVSTGIVRL